MKKIFLSALKVIAPVLLFSTAMQASAALVTTIHSGLATGSIGGDEFEAYFAITSVSDTSTITSCGDTCLSNINLSTTIFIDSVGTFAFVTPTSYISDESGIAFARADGTSLFENSTDVAWDMASTLPPVIGDATLLQWTLSNVVTTGGVLVLNDGATLSAFTATVADVCEVPLPAGAWLFGSGLIGMVGVARRKA